MRPQRRQRKSPASKARPPRPALARPGRCPEGIASQPLLVAFELPRARERDVQGQTTRRRSGGTPPRGCCVRSTRGPAPSAWSNRTSTGWDFGAKALSHELQYSRHLFARHVELLHDLIDAHVLKVLDHCSHGETSAFEHPGADTTDRRMPMATVRIRPGPMNSDPNPQSRRSLHVRFGARWRARRGTISGGVSRRGPSCATALAHRVSVKPRRSDLRRHAALPQSWIQRRNWEFETDRPVVRPRGARRR